MKKLKPIKVLLLVVLMLGSMLNGNIIIQRDINVDAANEKIIVYSATWCQYCTKVKNYLESKGINYEERDIDKNLKWIDEVKKISNQEGIPVTVYKGQHIVGYDTAKLDKMIEDYKSDQKSKSISRIDDKTIENNNNKDNQAIKSKKEKKIIIYGVKWFNKYQKGINYLEENKVKIEERDFIKNTKYFFKALNLSKKFKIPMFVYKDKVVSGFDKVKLDELIKIYKDENVKVNKDNKKDIKEGTKEKNPFIIYTKNDSKYSKETISFLKKNSIPFEERNIDVNKEWAKTIYDLVKEPVLPVTVYKNKALVGYIENDLYKMIEDYKDEVVNEEECEKIIIE